MDRMQTMYACTLVLNFAVHILTIRLPCKMWRATKNYPKLVNKTTPYRLLF